MTGFEEMEAIVRVVDFDDMEKGCKSIVSSTKCPRGRGTCSLYVSEYLEASDSQAFLHNGVE